MDMSSMSEQWSGWDGVVIHVRSKKHLKCLGHAFTFEQDVQYNLQKSFYGSQVASNHLVQAIGTALPPQSPYKATMP